MPDALRFEHRILSWGEHCLTSPDVKGLCAVAATEAEARRGADVLLAESGGSASRSAPGADWSKPEAA